MGMILVWLNTQREELDCHDPPQPAHRYVDGSADDVLNVKKNMDTNSTDQENVELEEHK